MSLNMGELIRVKNVTGFPVGFMRINGGGEVNIPPYTSISVDRGEVISQAQSGDIRFCGENGDISHAMLYIEDEETRRYVGFDTEETKQEVVDISKIEKAFNAKTMSAFKKSIDEIACNFVEKHMLIEAVKKLGINDYNKIKYVEQITGMKVE